MITVIELSQEVYTNVLAATKWYEEMPVCLNEVVGDRFGENMSEFFAEFVPESDDGFYFDHFETTEQGGLVAVFGQHTTDDETPIPVVFKD